MYVSEVTQDSFQSPLTLLYSKRLFVCFLLFTDPTCKWRHVHVIVLTLESLCPPSVWMEQAWRGPPGWHRDHLVRAHRASLRHCGGADWEWLMELGRWGGMTRSAAQLQTPSQLPCCAATWHIQLSDNAAYTPTHHTSSVSLTGPARPHRHAPLPQTTVRIPAEEEEPSSFSRNHLCCCAVDTGILFVELLSPVTLRATVFNLEHLKEKRKSSSPFRWHFRITFCTIWQSCQILFSVFLSKC